MRLLVLVFALFSLSVCSAAAPPPGAPPSTPAGEKARALVAGGARLLDVRTPAEFAEGHIEGAINIPVDSLEKRVGELGAKDEPVVVYCRRGRRSAIAEKILRDAGFTQVYDLGSIGNW